MSDQHEEAQDAFKAWRAAERAYRTQCRDYYSLVDSNDTTHSVGQGGRELLAELTKLRVTADAARTEYENSL